MAKLTDKGLAKLETLRDYWPPRGKGASAKMTQRYLLLKVEDSPEFIIDQHSMLRPDWNRLKDQGLIIDATVEPIYVIEGTDRPLHRGKTEKFVKTTRPSDANYRLGQIVPKQDFDRMVEAVTEQGGEPPLGEDL